jgi:hypothetical protein
MFWNFLATLSLLFFMAAAQSITAQRAISTCPREQEQRQTINKQNKAAY